MAFLPQETFTTVIDSTPLVSIDLVVENTAGEVLFGFRNNRPAQGYWFVPGGRILKNETLDAAFLRLTENELGHAIPRSEARLLDVYEHFYTDSVMGESPSTHYVVLGYHLVVDSQSLALPLGDQHQDYMWQAKAEAANNTGVHAHSAAYLPAITHNNE